MWIHQRWISQTSEASSATNLPRLPSTSTGGDKENATALKERIKQLETKLDTYLAWESDPFLNNQVPATCKNQTSLHEFCSDCSLGNMPICLDDFPYGNCIVYDFGIREEPDFGVILSKPPFSCQVFGFDPSPITQEWLKENNELRENPNYKLFLYGGGGADETITLREYNWGQVSILQYPRWVLNPNNCTETVCRSHIFPRQERHSLKVRSVSSIMKELGHDHVDILKIDVEGSEYRMLEGMITSGACGRIGQMTLEWHHYSYDSRYGYGTDPHLNLLHRLLREECGLYQFWLHSPQGWPSNEKLYVDMNLPLFYNLASFKRIAQMGSSK